MHVVHFAQFNFLFLIPANPRRYMLPKLGQDSALLRSVEMTNGHAQLGTNETTLSLLPLFLQRKADKNISKCGLI